MFTKVNSPCSSTGVKTAATFPWIFKSSLDSDPSANLSYGEA